MPPMPTSFVTAHCNRRMALRHSATLNVQCKTIDHVNCVVAGFRTNDLAVCWLWWFQFFSLSLHAEELSVQPASCLVSVGSTSLGPGLPGCVTDNSPSTDTEDRNVWGHTSTPNKSLLETMLSWDQRTLRFRLDACFYISFILYFKWLRLVLIMWDKI
jgi:hypothetical protein